MNYYKWCNACGFTRNFINWPTPNDPALVVCARCRSPTHDWRREITDPEGGTHYVDLRRDCQDGHPWQLVGDGHNFRSPEAAQVWLAQHWNDPATEDRRVAMAQATVGEAPAASHGLPGERG